MIDDALRRAWEEDGFFILRGFADPAIGAVMAQETIAAIRADPPSAHPGEASYGTARRLLVQPEAKPVATAVNPEDHVAKLFNPHLSGTAAAFARDPRCGTIVRDLIGPDVDVFQSMFIFKSAGAWGQPWHQDSYYFRFDTGPQVGLWLAISAATPENGCLSVIPGSHRRDVLPHGPDRRPGANQGYTEIEGIDEDAARIVEMAPGDLLVFHSHLIHKSVDNRSSDRRMAMVYHYGVAGTRNLAPPEIVAIQERVTQWVPVMRGGVPA